MIAWICTALVGSAFLFSAFVKAVDGRTFLRDLARYRLLPPSTVSYVAAVGTGGEAALGAALVMHVAPSVVVPAAAGLVIALAGLTLWAERARDLEDCGCYGGVVLLTPRQSAALDGAYLALLGTALWMPAGASWAPVEIGLGATILVGGAAGVAAWHSRRPLASAHGPALEDALAAFASRPGGRGAPLPRLPYERLSVLQAMGAAAQRHEQPARLS